MPSRNGSRPSSAASTKNYGLLMRRAGVPPGVASIVLLPATVSVTVGGISAFYSVTLRCSNAPKQPVTVSPVNLPTGLRVLPALHVFTPDNWQEPQYFRVAAVNGGVFEELRGSAAIIEHTTSSLDPRYHGRRVIHLPSSVQAVVSPRDGYHLFATGKTAAFSSQLKLKHPTLHEFTEIELQRSTLGPRPLVARCSTLVPMAAGAIAAVAAVEAANQAAAQSRRRLSTAATVVKVMTTRAKRRGEEPTTRALDHRNAIVKLSTHGDKTLALYHDGEMVTLGSTSTNSKDGGTDVVLSRMLLDVSCGDKHVVGTSEQGYLLTWGGVCEARNKTKETANVPRIVQSLLHKRIVQVSCGASHSFALAEDGDVFSWGIGRSGALGHGLNAHEQTFETVISPMEVLALKGRRVVQITCGDVHTAVLLQSGQLLTCGQREYGRLGRHMANDKASDGLNDEYSSWFAPVAFPNSVKCTYAACGAAHTLAVTGAYELYAFGWNCSGQLGLGDCRDRFIPTRVVYFDAVGTLSLLTIASVAAGKQHSLVSCPDGRLFAWGSDEMGQCGLNSCPQIYTLPHLVTSLVGLRVTQLAAGEAHSTVLTSHSQQYLETLERTQPIQYTQLVEFYENAVKDDSERRSQVFERARRHQLERAAAARRRKPPVDPATEALAKLLELQALVDQDEALDAQYKRARRPQTARNSTKDEENGKYDQVRCSSAAMMRQARLAVLQATLALMAAPLSQKSTAVSKPSKCVKHRRPVSATSSTRRQKTSEGQRQLTATLLNQSVSKATKISPAFPPSRPKSAPCRSTVRKVVDTSGTCIEP